MMVNRSVLLSLACGAALATSAAAGPLDPPAGPITSTFKTLNEVEPRIAINAVNTPGDSVALYVINNPGSYYLPANVNVTSNGLRGIRIDASNVTIDLNGFALIGNGVGDDAIYVTFLGTANLTVRNGSIRNWVKEGVDAFAANNCLIENVRVDSSVAGYGIITGAGSTIRNCLVRSSAAGIVTTAGCTVRDCTATNNGAGFLIGSGNTVVGCTAMDSTAGPGFQTGPGCTLAQCTAYNNRGATGFGFDLASGNTVTACTAHTNDQDGFHFQTGASNVSVTGCNASSNRGNGIRTENGVGHIISGNICSRNNANGIHANSGCTIQNNTCENNGTLVGASTSGIFVSGSYNRIDGNTVMASAFGIAVASGQINNVAIRNTATLCTTPYSFPAGVAYGTINFLPSGAFSDTNSFANIRF